MLRSTLALVAGAGVALSALGEPPRKAAADDYWNNYWEWHNRTYSPHPQSVPPRTVDPPRTSNHAPRSRIETAPRTGYVAPRTRIDAGPTTVVPRGPSWRITRRIESGDTTYVPTPRSRIPDPTEKTASGARGFLGNADRYLFYQRDRRFNRSTLPYGGGGMDYNHFY